MLRIVCWKWTPPTGYRSQFSAVHVNTLFNMIERHYSDPHEVVCITDDPRGIDPRVRVVPLWDTFAGMRSVHGEFQPCCYRRLPAFKEEMREIIGPRFVSVDLDCVIVNDMRPVWNRTEDFVIWQSRIKNTCYNGSMWMMDAGARAFVFDKFDPRTSPREARHAGHLGSDQAWMSFVLGPDQPVWTRNDGVVNFRMDLRAHGWRLPSDARIVFFAGHIDPWSQFAKDHAPWVLEHYR